MPEDNISSRVTLWRVANYTVGNAEEPISCRVLAHWPSFGVRLQKTDELASVTSLHIRIQQSLFYVPQITSYIFLVYFTLLLPRYVNGVAPKSPHLHLNCNVAVCVTYRFSTQSKHPQGRAFRVLTSISRTPCRRAVIKNELNLSFLVMAPFTFQLHSRRPWWPVMIVIRDADRSVRWNRRY